MNAGDGGTNDAPVGRVITVEHFDTLTNIASRHLSAATCSSSFPFLQRKRNVVLPIGLAAATVGGIAAMFLV